MSATVVVSCYNQKKYIRECLDSILNQEVDFEFNILVSDDSSTDGTKEIIIEYQDNFPNKINALARDQNIGPAKNYIEAHKAATGDVVFHMDGDDVMLPGKLQKQYELFRTNPGVNLVFHRALYFSDDGSYTSQTGTPQFSENGFMYFNVYDLALWGPITVHSSYAYRKSSRSDNWPDREFSEWYFAMDSLLPHGTGAYIDEILVKYRCNLRGNTYLSTKEGRKKGYNLYLKDIVYYFNLYSHLRSALYSNALVTALAMVKSIYVLPELSYQFLFKNIFLFNPKHFIKTLKMRKSVSPKQKIR
jgi:glycosyltransferase involved in cell wall biosynthesis